MRLMVRAEPVSVERLAVVGNHEIVSYKFRISPDATRPELQAPPQRRPFMDVAEASVLSGKSRAQIRRLLASGNLKGEKVSGRWRIRSSSLSRLIGQD